MLIYMLPPIKLKVLFVGSIALQIMPWKPWKMIIIYKRLLKVKSDWRNRGLETKSLQRFFTGIENHCLENLIQSKRLLTQMHKDYTSNFRFSLLIQYKMIQTSLFLLYEPLIVWLLHVNIQFKPEPYKVLRDALPKKCWCFIKRIQ